MLMTQGNWKVRTGEARGSDKAFRECCTRGDIFCYKPALIKHEQNLLTINDVKTFSNYLQAREIAKYFHPKWDRLNPEIQSIMTRNVYQVLGHDLNTPSEVVICYTNDGRYKSTTSSTGGTGQAIRIAIGYNIPVYNIKNDDHFQTLKLYNF